MDSKEIEKFNERKKVIENLRTNLKDARTMKNKNWAEALLKLSVEKSMEVQEVFRQEIEDCPASKNVTSFSELANSIVNTVTAVMELDREEERIAISKEKNELRKKELESNGGRLIDAQGKTVGIGTNEDIMKLVKNNIIDVKELKSGDDNASS